MRPFEELSGKWIGWSIQFGQKIHENIDLSIGGGRVNGAGCDKDGDFVLDGYYDRRQTVTLTRRYTYCTAGPEGIGIPYTYRGKWDGAQVCGHWRPRALLNLDGGAFEMWPHSEEDMEIEMREAEAVGTR